MYKRNCYTSIAEALKDTPVVLICGARQVGKSTIIQELISNNHDYHYLNMDDPTNLAAATNSPISFLSGINGKIVIDEIQRAPELFLVIKKMVDENRQPGKFILTGSANVLTLPKLSDSLAGRMEIINMHPLSQGEIHGMLEDFIDQSFNSETFANNYPRDYESLVAKILNGGYPEVLARASSKRKSAWFSSYITALLQRDIRDLANIDGLRALPTLLSLLATRAGNLANLSELSRLAKIPGTTLTRYIALLEAIFLTTYVSSWYINQEKRVVKTPKLYFNDTGLLCHLFGVDSKKLLADRHFTGPILENFVLMELIKQRSWSHRQVKIYHYRTHSGNEVDIVLEASNGDIVGIEVKSHEEVIGKDFNGLRHLKEIAGLKFQAGYVLYTGKKKIQFEDRLLALPISALWL